MRDGWRLATFGDAVDLDLEQVAVEPGVDYPVVGVLNRGRGLLVRTPVTSETTKYRKLNKVRSGQLVYSKLKAFEGSITVAPDDLGDAFASQEFPTFTCRSDVLPAFLRLVAGRPQLWDELAAVSKGMGGRRERVGPDDLLALPLMLPPIHEQQRIVDMLGAVDNVIAGYHSIGDALEQTWWAACRATEHQTSGLKMVQLGAIAEIGGGIAKNKADAGRPDAVEAPYLRAANVQRRCLDLGEVSTIVAPASKIEGALLRPGDILMNEGGDRDKLGRGAVWRGQVDGCVHQNHVFRVRLTTERFLPEFVSAWANSYGQRWFDTNGSQTTGIASVSKTTLSRFPVPEVELSTQRAWVDSLDEMTSAQEEAGGTVAALASLRSHLLTVLLSGEHEIPSSYDELLEGVSA